MPPVIDESKSVLVTELEAGAVWRVTLATPKANLVDRDKSRRLTEIFGRAAADPRVKAIVIEGDSGLGCGADAVLSGDHLKAGLPQVEPDQLHGVGFIIDHEYLPVPGFHAGREGSSGSVGRQVTFV